MNKNFGFVALIGASNSGKSTLVNTLVEKKISIVTHKVQTTRRCIRGIITDQNSQVVLIDTPGLFQGKNVIDKTIMRHAWYEVEQADIILFLMDINRWDQQINFDLLDKLKVINKPVILCLNKIDLIVKSKLLPIIQNLSSKFAFQEIFNISALKRYGTDELKSYLINNVPKGEWCFQEQDNTDISAQIMAQEITREEILLNVHQEVPYKIFVTTDLWTKKKDKSYRVDQIIWVEREQYRAIILGKKGQNIRRIGEGARIKMQEYFQNKVHLFLQIKVDRHRKKRNIYETSTYQ